MFHLGMISFAAPWVLVGAAALPAVWLLLRITPPAVRQMAFPAVRLLFGLDPTQRTTAHTPPWLLILRIGLLALAILGLADPVLNLHPAGRSGPLVVAFDDGWAAATQWQERIKALRDVLDAADRQNREVALITTAAKTTTSPIQMQAARDALSTAAHLAPQPWATDRIAAAQSVRALHAGSGASTLWISDGVATPGADDLASALSHIGPLTVIDGGAAHPPLVLMPPQRQNIATPTDSTANGVTVQLKRIARDDAAAATHIVRALDGNGRVLGETSLDFKQGAQAARGVLALPPELANTVARFDVAGVVSAATTVLADDRWQRRPVGVASATASGVRAPLLENAFYLKQALAPFADVHTGDLDDLLTRPLAVLIMADGGKILDNELGRITKWVESGGLLLRFAGPELEANVDPLLPVRLRSGGRTFGGAMSWGTPAHLAPFPDNSPFKDLLVPDDVTVSSQVLAEPSADLPARTWARLRDGTPLVTAERKGRGWIVLFHVTATPEWSKLPLSGLFMDMLRRIVDLSHGIEADPATIAGPLAPRNLLDGFGRLNPPGPTAVAVAAQAFADGKVGPDAPPGLYGQPGATRALNLSTSLGSPAALSPPAGAVHEDFAAVVQERALKPWLLTAALILLLADLAISFALRRLVPEVRTLARGAAGAMIAAAMLVPHAQANDTPRDADIDPAIRAAILDTRLAYVVTGNADVDRIAGAGLDALTHVLAARTAAELAAPARLDLNTQSVTADALIPYPLIYWRISTAQQKPSARALAAVNSYMHRGGMVVFDAPDQAGALASDGNNHARLDQILHNLDLPPLTRLAEDHVLNRSFYLLHGLPGRYTDSAVYVERNTAANDGVSSVIIGGNDWAAAWARDERGIPLYAAVPGGERQREMAYRVGVNMVMYALTGNYKSDQVHLPAILQRLTQ